DRAVTPNRDHPIGSPFESGAKLLLALAQRVFSARSFSDLFLQQRIGGGKFSGPLLNSIFQFIMGFFQFGLGMFEIGDIERDPVNEPGATLLSADHLDVTMEPN